MKNSNTSKQTKTVKCYVRSRYSDNKEYTNKRVVADWKKKTK